MDLEAAPPPDGDPASTATLAREILDTHHALLHRELPRLERDLRGAPAVVRAPFLRLSRVLAEHLMKEEHILFPAILGLAERSDGGGCGVSGPIAQMSAEHTLIRELEVVLRRHAADAGAAREALLLLLDDLAEHARKEDERLFPQALWLERRAIRPRDEDPGDAGERCPPPASSVPETSPPRSPIPEPGEIRLRHLGESGLALRIDGAELFVDPPFPVEGPAVLTWSEAERVLGVGAAAEAGGWKGELAAARPILDWLGCRGVVLQEDQPVSLGGFDLRVRPFEPIPYATPAEALRKARSALRHPGMAARRLAFTLRRPDTPPLVVVISRGGQRVVMLGQALHRFVTPEQARRLATWVGPVELVVAGTDYDDERATGALLGMFEAKSRVLADLIGDVRARLGLPVRPLSLAMSAAPAGTHTLRSGGSLVL